MTPEQMQYIREVQAESNHYRLALNEIDKLKKDLDDSRFMHSETLKVLDVYRNKIEDLNMDISRLEAKHDSLTADLVNREAKIAVAVEGLEIMAAPIPIKTLLTMDHKEISKRLQDKARATLSKIRGEK
jgi:septal ring factor EnvC (AmiA/AmiB activator)